MNAKEVTPNFSWFTITELTFYFSAEFGMDTFIANCKSNKFCKELVSIIERCMPGGIISISAIGHNKSGLKMNWGTLIIKITQ